MTTSGISKVTSSPTSPLPDAIKHALVCEVIPPSGIVANLPAFAVSLRLPCSPDHARVFAVCLLLQPGRRGPCRLRISRFSRSLIACIREELASKSITPAGPAADVTILRRTTLDLAGRISKTHGRNSSTLKAVSPSEKREKLVDGCSTVRFRTSSAE